MLMYIPFGHIPSQKNKLQAAETAAVVSSQRKSFWDCEKVLDCVLFKRVRSTPAEELVDTSQLRFDVLGCYDVGMLLGLIMD